MSINIDRKKKRIEQRKKDAVKDALKAKMIPTERYTSEAADFINFGLRNRQRKKSKKK